MKKETSLKEWQQIGGQAKLIRSEIFKLRKNGINLPRNIQRLLDKSLDNLEQFRCKAEDQMLISGISDDLSIFYGPVEYKDKIPSLGTITVD